MKFNNGKKIACVIQFQKAKKAPTLPVEALEGLGAYFYILHDKDTDKNGEFKGLHAHLVIFSDKGRSSGSWIAYLSGLFQVEEEAISIEIVKNDKSAVQYLIHATKEAKEEGKYQYDKAEIQTNKKGLLTELLKKQGLPTNEELASCETEYDLIQLVGWQNYNKALKAWMALRRGLENPTLQNQLKDISEGVEALGNLIAYCMKTGTPSNEVLIERLQEIQILLTIGKKDI